MSLPVLTISQMREWEKATWATGQTEVEVIRRVGKAVANCANRVTRPGDLILILAGNGHNGEDARCAREHLADRRVDVLEAKDPKADFSKLETILSLNPALIIDGLFGIGLNRPLSEEWRSFIERINQARRPVLAVDVPSGLDADSGQPRGAAIEAVITLTVGAPKVGLLKPPAWRFTGGLEVASNVGLVGCPSVGDLGWITSEDFVDFPPRRLSATHKGTYGHLGIVAGSLGFHGAAVLAARGAQRAQPGLITLHAQESVYRPIASQLQAVMVALWASGESLPKEHSTILIGPGLASADLPEEVKTLTRRIWSDSSGPVVVDASALSWLPSGPIKSEAARVITPHPGEAGKMLKSSADQIQADRVGAVRELSNRFGNAWVVLKGHQTLIGRSSGPVFVNSSGNPYLAQGGSGDVLAGFLAGLLAQPDLQEDILKTICYAVWEHGKAADRLQECQRGWVVEELVEELGQ